MNYRAKRKKFRPFKIVIIIALVVGFICLASGLVMLLWNAIIPNLTGFKKITFWQALALLLLFRILSGGFRFRSNWKNGKFKKKSFAKDKWMNMSAEEKAAFKAKWKERCNKK